MRSLDVEQVNALIVSCLERQMTAMGLRVDTIPDHFDMREQGVIDSLGFLQLLTELEKRLGFAIDLVDLDPDDLTRVGCLARYIAGLPRLTP